MPVFESVCPDPECDEYCWVVEHYTPHNTDPDPPCIRCGITTVRIPSNFATPWTGTLDRFNQKGYETNKPIQGGHMAWRTRSSRLANGAPEPVRITTRQEQMEYCRAEGLEDPAGVNPHMEVAEDGTSASFFSVPGVWAPVAAKVEPRRRVSPEVFAG